MSSGVIFVIESLGGGGAQQVMSSIANVWAEKGVDVTAITIVGEEKDVFVLSPLIHRVVIGGEKKSKNIVSAMLSNINRILKLRCAIKNGQGDCVISFVGAMNIVTILSAVGLGKRVIISERNDPARQSLGRVWDFLRWLTYRFAHVVSANSIGAIREMAKFVPEDKLVLLPNPVRKPASQEKATLTKPTILAVGRLHHQKGFDVLIAAFAKFKTEFPDWELVILGEGGLRSELQKLASQLKIENSTLLLGHQDPFPYYFSSRIFVHPARYEGVPNAVLEAMSCGLPVVATEEQEGLAGIIEHRESGYIVAANSVDQLVNALKNLALSGDFAAKLGESAKLAVGHLDGDSVARFWATNLKINL